jgi:predicted PurR-regulated permease PerM
METLSFTLGVLSVIITAFVVVLVWGIVKVVKQQEQINEINNRFEDLVRQSDHTETEIYRQINDQVADAVTQSKSYIDSRIDKTSSKQLIKG